MGTEHIGAGKLGHAYAVTAHRSQGATVDTAHALEDGGGRELAYVAMSRARHESHIHVVAHDARHAAERLTWAWEQRRRQTWALDREPVKSLAELYVERSRLVGSLPRDVSAELDRYRHQLTRVDQDARDLATGPVAGQAPPSARQRARRGEQLSLTTGHSSWKTCAAPGSSESARKPGNSNGAMTSNPTSGTGSTCEPFTKAFRSRSRSPCGLRPALPAGPAPSWLGQSMGVDHRAGSACEAGCRAAGR
jgi:hypothetical protein